MEKFVLSLIDVAQIAPEIHLIVWSSVILLVMLFIRQKERFREVPFYLALLGIGLAGYTWWRQAVFFMSLPDRPEMLPFFNQLYSVDGFSLFFKAFFLAAGLLTVLIARRFLEVEKAVRSEFYAIILFSMTAMMFMASGIDLITIYISLEFMAITIYLLVGYLQTRPRSIEASLKYFILGAFSSALLLFGMSLLYGLTGSTLLNEIRTAAAGAASGGKMLIMSMLFILAGLGFKIAAVPFHMWCPDAYEGAPTPVTAFMSVAAKAAGFAIFIRIFTMVFQPLFPDYMIFLGILSILSMTLGNVLAVKQTNVKRMLAYSSISHAGYLLMGLMVRHETGLQAVGVYLICYLFMNMGAFTILVLLRRGNLPGEELDDFAGLVHKRPALAACMTIFLLSLAGIPPTAGFIAKYWVFSAVIQGYLAGNQPIFLYVAIAGALNAVVALFYYFGIVRRMFMDDEREIPPLAESWGSRLAVGITAGATLFLGMYPEPAIKFAAWLKMAFAGLL